MRRARARRRPFRGHNRPLLAYVGFEGFANRLLTVNTMRFPRRLHLRLAIAAVLASAPFFPVVAAPQTGASSAHDAAAALVRGDTGQAVVAYTEALKDPGLTNDRRATILNDRAVAYARLGQSKLAIDDFNRAATLFPEYAAIYNNRGSLLLALDHAEEAIKDFDRAIVLAPGYAAALSNRAGAYTKTGQTDLAIRDYTRAVRLMPQTAAPLSGRGRVHLVVGRPYAAIRDFTRAVNADARFATAYRSRAEANLALGRRKEAIEDLSRAIAFNADNAELYLLRGDAYLAMENIESALKDFSRVIELDPGSASGYAARGLARGLAGAHEDAFADLNRAITIDPRSSTAFAYRAIVYKQSGQADVGSRDAETATKLDAKSPEALWARGEIAEAQDRNEDAIADFRRALEAKPALKLAADGLQRLGADVGDEEDREIPGHGIDGWEVVARGDQYFAVNKKLRRLRVPLEMAGDGQPRLLEWDQKRGNLRGIATLRFAAGAVPGPVGPEEFEQVAILDLNNNSVVAIEPHRQGKKVASWQWQDDRVIVASVDGATDEFILRTGRARSRYATGGGYGESGAWSPWSQFDGPPPTQRRAKRRRKPKTLFQLLFQ